MIGNPGRLVPFDDVRPIGVALRDLVTIAAGRPLIDAGRIRLMQRVSVEALVEETITFWQDRLA